VVVFDIEYWLWAIGRLMALGGTRPFERIAASAETGGELVIDGPTKRPPQWQSGSRTLYVERRRYHRARPTGSMLATCCETPSLRPISISRPDVGFLNALALSPGPRRDRREA
jgi:hypothetical protein